MLFFLLLTAIACGDGAGDSGDSGGSSDPGNTRGDGDGEAGPIRGEDVYGEPLADGNTFACVTCHAMQEPADDSLRRPGHPIGDAAARPDYKNGQLTSLRDAVNSCVVEWMNAEPLGEDDERWLALSELLEEEAEGAEGESVEIQIVQPAADLTGGDAVAGMETFDGTCAVCHGAGAAGTQQAPPLIGTKLDPETIATRVRLSGRADSDVYDDLQGGIMPFWGADRMSDAELLDVVAYVEEIGQVERTEVADPPGGDETMPGGSGCGQDHPRVGATTELSTIAHQVSGTVRVVDDCTLVIEDFSFDGGGIEVRVYGGVGGEFDPPTGFSMSDDLLGMVFDGSDTLTVRLPDDRTLDDLDSVSIWCVAVGTSFGHGTF